MGDDQALINETTSANKSPWQFRLFDLFLLTTYIAVVVALAIRFGPQTLVTALGFGLAWLNYRGMLVRLQTGRMQAALLGAAWMTFIVSMFVPVSGGWMFLGWQIVGMYLEAPFATVFNLQGANVDQAFWPWVAAFDAANILQALLPLLMWRLARERGKWLSSTLCVAMVAVWMTLIVEPNLFVGYYVWCASFFLAFVALRIDRTTLIAMVAICPLLLSSLLLGD